MILLFKNYITLCVLSALAVGMYGCAEINPFEVPEEVIRHPLGTESIKIGMHKEEVVKEWGTPDIINKLGTQQDATGTQQEEWIYKARQYAVIPVDAGYLSKNKYLYFDGNNLTSISDGPKSE